MNMALAAPSWEYLGRVFLSVWTDSQCVHGAVVIVTSLTRSIRYCCYDV